ncbi:PREDICTED: free fatty acid receptor 2-like [Haliaeetus leucocephalus]|uniref:free fatty acid receptor 2-like n=1 Tax=Haliaeetus leucocephalus TaxID=52644 RepID=UPI00053CCCD9|nr:PREDICTED: free fatty acid receptor 2-like [Haliaeetus leucocephalus]
MLVLTIYILTFSVGFPANVFTFATLLGKARRRVSPSDILLLNLTAADLLLLLFLPFKMAEAAAGMTWPLPAVLCPVANFCFYSSIYLSSLFLAALSVERYLGVVFPLQYKDRRRPARVMAASAVLWLLACSHCSIVFVAQYHGGGNQTPANRSTVMGSDGSTVNGSKSTNSDISARSGSRISSPTVSTSKISTTKGANIQDISGPTGVSQTSNIPSSSAPSVHDRSTTDKIQKCYDDFSEDQLSFVLPLRLELFLVLFLLPFTVTIFCYINFVRALLARPNIPLEKKQRAVGLAVATMVNFGVCFAPYNLSHVVGFVEKRSPDWRVYALLLTSLNAALDPLVFYFSSTAVQRAMAGVVVAMQDKLRVVVGWYYWARSPGPSQNESEGSLT